MLLQCTLFLKSKNVNDINMFFILSHQIMRLVFLANHIKWFQYTLDIFFLNCKKTLVTWFGGEKENKDPYSNHTDVI